MSICVSPQDHVYVSMKLNCAALWTPPQNLDIELFRRCSAIKESTFLWVFLMNWFREMKPLDQVKPEIWKMQSMQTYMGWLLHTINYCATFMLTAKTIQNRYKSLFGFCLIMVYKSGINTMPENLMPSFEFNKQYIYIKNNINSTDCFLIVQNISKMSLTRNLSKDN